MTRIAIFDPRGRYDDIERLAQINLDDVVPPHPCGV